MIAKQDSIVELPSYVEYTRAGSMPVTLRPHALQSLYYRTRTRFNVVVAGRGSGKTEVAKRRTIRKLGTRHPMTTTPWYFYGLPTTAQAKRVAWESLKALLPLEWYEPRGKGKTFYEADRIIRTRFGSELHVVGLDVPHRIEGNQWCGGVLDESSDQRPGVFDLTVRPALTAYEGWCDRIGVPKRYGIGAEDFKKAYDYAASGVDPDYLALHWYSATVVDPDELQRIKQALNDRDYKEQYEASWEQISGAIFHAFNESYNVSDAVCYQPDQRLVIGSDFNVDPMCWCVGHRYKNQFIVFDELEIRNTNTRETLNELYNRYPQHKAGWDFVGDASAKARKTSASKSDYVQILNDERFADKKVYYPKANPAVVDRFAACNNMFYTAAGESRVLIHPRCKRLIKDLMHRSFKPNTKEPADTKDMGHMSDAFGYVVYKFWPPRVSIQSSSEIIIRNG